MVGIIRLNLDDHSVGRLTRIATKYKKVRFRQFPDFVDDRRSKERPNNSLKNHEDDETTTASYYKPEQMVHYNTPHNYNAHNAGKLRYNPAVAGNVVFVDPATQQQHLLPPPMLFMPTPPDCNRYFGTAYNGIPIDASSMMPMQGGQTQTSPGHDSGGMIVDPSSIQGPQHHQQFPTGVPPGVLPPPHQHFAACSGSMYGAAPSGAVLPPPGIPPPPPLHLLPAHVQSQIAAAFSQAPPPGMYFPMPSAAPGGPLGKHHQQDAMNCCWPTNQPPHSLLGLPTMPPTMQPPPPSATSGAPHQQVGSQCQPMRPQSSYYTLCTELVATALAGLNTHLNILILHWGIAMELRWVHKSLDFEFRRFFPELAKKFTI